MSKILVVDDELGIRKLCYDLFTKAGHEVISIARGEQIFEILRSQKPDLILLDIGIPGEEGLSLLNRMPRDRDNKTSVVIFSGSVTPELEKEAMEKGAIDVFRKGLGIQELKDKVEKILSSKRRTVDTPEETKRDKLLIVDDEEGIRHLLTTFFQKEGFEILTAKNGEEALHQVEKERPQMILLDVTMPGMDGILTLQKIREIDPKVGVVMATGVSDERIAKEATELGAYAYVIKPFDMRYLKLVVLTRLLLSA